MRNMLCALSIGSALLTFAQEDQPTIATDRPGQSFSSSIVPAGSVQIESGYTLEQDQDVDGTNFNFLLRWGLNEFLEVRFQQDYLTSDTESASFSGFGATRLGIKSVIAKEEGWMPEIALIGSLILPSGESIYQTRNNTPEFAFSTSKALTDRLSVCYNLGMSWDDDSPEHTNFYTLIFGYSISDRLSGFIEPYGFLRKDTKADSRINGGFAYLLNPSVQFDISGGVGITSQSPDSFISFGGAIVF
ncbi:MAG: transporter [Bacteroidota bacterium]